MIVGATDAPDAAILDQARGLYEGYKLRRVYYSAFSPIPFADSRLPVKAAPLLREHRLYQADWLFRYYGFGVEELTTEASPNLSLDHDPKLAWALRNRHLFPVDVNRAAKEMLLRVPGLGVRNVQRILKIRRHQRLRLEDLARLKAPVVRMRPFVITSDHNPALRSLDTVALPETLRAPATQLSLFEAGTAALTGEL
jgi:predicted DNA-binding helix-hairpin-helix protein